METVACCYSSQHLRHLQFSINLPNFTPWREGSIDSNVEELQSRWQLHILGEGKCRTVTR